MSASQSDLRKELALLEELETLEAEELASNPDQQVSPAGAVDFNVGTMVSNIPSSAADIAIDTFKAVTSPIETGKALVELGGSALEKLGRTFEEFALGEDIAPTEGKEDAANAVGAYMKDRYGSFDGFKTALMEDPAGVLLDFSSFGMASKIPKVSKIAQTVIEPVNLAINIGKEAARRVIPQKVATKLYESAAKFSTTLTPEKRASMIQTALDEGIMPTGKGVVLVEDRVSILNNMLEDLIQTSTSANSKIPVGVIYKHINELIKAKGGVKIEAMSDVKKIQKIVGDFHISMKGRTHVTPAELQTFKKDAYKKINWDAKRLTGSPVKEDTFKVMARGAKEGIEEAIPEASEINKALGELYELQPHLARSASRIENNNIISLGGGLKMGGAGTIGAISGNPVVGVSAGVLAHIISTPKMKARLAIAINKLKSGDAAWLNSNSHLAEVRVALALAGRAETDNQEAQ